MLEVETSFAVMNLSQRLRECIDSLSGLRRRSLLALLGILAGTGAIVALLNIGHSAAEDVMRTFKGMGTDTLVLTFPIGRPNRPMPPNLDLHALQTAVADVSHAASVGSFGIPLRVGGRNVDARVVAATSQLAQTIDMSVLEGRLLSVFDHNGLFAVIGSRVAVGVALGDDIQIGSYLYRVVGIAQPLPENPFLPFDADGSVFIPFEGLQRQLQNPKLDAVVIRADSSADLEVVQRALKQYFSIVSPGRQVDVRIPRQWLEGMKRQSDTLSYLLAALGGLSLLVGGVGVMNVMLMNVSERRREIGLRMALGARPRDIGIMFLLEAGCMAVVGAMAGTMLGLAASYAFVLYSGWQFVFEPWSLPLGIGSALLIGLFFGISPALAAARMQPVQALRDV
ncbi:ABC transporter permease [Achromobacter xylosoxidans]|jgi:putative ABC transport system permease protein